MIQGNPKIMVHTDHAALLNRNADRMTGRQHRWNERIREISTNLVHVKGCDNPADYWSRQGWKWGGDNWYT